MATSEFQYFIHRLKSFDNILDSNLHLDVVSLAHAGFYHLNGKILCYSCGYVFKKIEDVIEPSFEHVFYTTCINKDFCYYLKKTTGVNLYHTFIMHKFSLEPLDIDKYGPTNFKSVTIPSFEYDLFINRFITFSNIGDLPFSPLLLSHFGYHYSTDDDKICCFDCHHSFSYSKPLKDQIEDHMSRSCGYTKSILGSDITVLKFIKCLDA